VVYHHGSPCRAVIFTDGDHRLYQNRGFPSTELVRLCNSLTVLLGAEDLGKDHLALAHFDGNPKPVAYHGSPGIPLEEPGLYGPAVAETLSAGRLNAVNTRAVAGNSASAGFGNDWAIYRPKDGTAGVASASAGSLSLSGPGGDAFFISISIVSEEESTVSTHVSHYDRIKEILVRPGDKVDQDQVLIELAEHTIRAPKAGTVREINCRVGQKSPPIYETTIVLEKQ
jgi:hypothetical protein